LSLVGTVTGRFDAPDGWPYAYETSHHDGCKHTHVGHNTGRRNDTGLDESE
jgi:hypothetical protein